MRVYKQEMRDQTAASELVGLLLGIPPPPISLTSVHSVSPGLIWIPPPSF